jgi:hypothetical protein
MLFRQLQSMRTFGRAFEEERLCPADNNGNPFRLARVHALAPKARESFPPAHQQAINTTNFTDEEAYEEKTARTQQIAS